MKSSQERIMEASAGPRPGLGNLRPAEYLNVAREIQVQYFRYLFLYRKHVKNQENF